MYGGAIYADQCSDNITLKNTKFRYNRALDGGAIMISASKIVDQEGEYENNFAVNGAVFHVDESYLSFNLTKFTNNRCHYGCLVYNDGVQAGITMNEIYAHQNWALYAAAIVYMDNYDQEYEDDDSTYVMIEKS